MLDTLIHKWARIPYVLHSEVHEPSQKSSTTVVLIHGIGNSGKAWERIVGELPEDYRIVTVDLLGFGQSPRPAWAIYDARTQARAILATLLKLRLGRRLIFVGHSLGSLVAVEIAHRYPLLVKHLILCSPPFYNIDEIRRRRLPNNERILRGMYRLINRHPDQFIAISNAALKLGLVNKSFNLNRDNAGVYMNALESSILNQTALVHAAKLDVPIEIIYGQLDPVVIIKNLKYLAKINSHVNLNRVMASHEISGPFIPAIIQAIITASEKK